MDTKVIIIYLRSKPLIKTVYSFDELSHAHVSRHGATGILLNMTDKREKEREQTEQAEQGKGFGKEGFNEEQPPEGNESHFRKIDNKKKKFSIWDYSELEYDELEKEIALKINVDGYYDEIVPIDKNEETENDNERGIKLNVQIVALMAAGIISLGIVLWILFDTFR